MLERSHLLYACQFRHTESRRVLAKLEMLGDDVPSDPPDSDELPNDPSGLVDAKRTKNSFFINYRGADSHAYGALLYTALAHELGEDTVFLDSESIQAGANYEWTLLSSVRRASAVLAIIGPRWLTATDDIGRRRIDIQEDWIRRELREAFSNRIRVIPILTDNATMPVPQELPTDIEALAYCQYRRLRHREASSDIAQILADLAANNPTTERTGRRETNQTTGVRNAVYGPIFGPVLQGRDFGSINLGGGTGP
jgi:hypothetical protein